jgi:hypothetical protein
MIIHAARIRFSFILLILLSFSVSLVSCSWFRDEKKPTDIIHQLQEMSDMATVEYTISKVVKVDDAPGWYKYGERKLLISCKARIKAGISMAEILEDDISVSGNSITLYIPQSRVISLNMDPESIHEEYSKTGLFRSTFTNEERYNFLQQAEKEIKENIAEMGILARADAHAVSFFESWLRLMGFEQVHVITKPAVPGI